MTNNYLIFDFDGVIGDTKTASARAKSVVNGTSIEEAERRDLEYSSTKPNHTRTNDLTAHDHKRIYDWIIRFGNEMNNQTFKLFSDFVREIVGINTDYKAVVSSGSQRYVLLAMLKTKINPTHILAYENHHSKEEKIETICKDWNCDVTEVYYFTDTLADVYELQNMISKDKLIGVSWGYCGKELLLKELDEEHILDTPSDIQKLFTI